MLELRIDCSPKDTQDDIAQIIHESLVGYEEYINNNILLNKDGDYITLLIGPESEKNKKLKLVCYVERVDETTHYGDTKMNEPQENEIEEAIEQEPCNNETQIEKKALDQESILDKIRAEINKPVIRDKYSQRQNDYCDGVEFMCNRIKEIIDKYKAESNEVVK